MTIQVVALILILAGIAWLANNTIQNLAVLGKNFDFGFLWQRAGYDINQRLIEYSNDSPHARAALVGILNTLLVALLGCITATVVGVIAGVLRLSKNWIVGRLMTVYVEAFRNIPLLLWIIVVFAVFNESQPVPAEFRPDGEASYSLFGLIAVTRQGTFIPRLAFSDGAFMAMILVLVGSIVVNRIIRRMAVKHHHRTGRHIPIFPISLAILIIPVVISFFVVSAVTSNRENVIFALGAETGQDLTSYAEGQSRIEFCSLPGSAGSLNLQRYIEAQDITLRSIPNGSFDAAVGSFSSGNCALLSVPASDADRVQELVRQVSSRELEVSQTIWGMSFRQAEADIATADPISFGILQDRTFEGNAFEVSRPEITPRGIARFQGGLHIRNSLIALWFALSLYTGAFIAEIVRAGIMSVSHGQTEAAGALGLRPNRIMNLVVLPQALRVIIPPLISQYLNLTKNSSLAIAVGYMDVRATLGGITINQTGRELEGMLLMGLFYLITSLAIAGVMNLYNASVKLQER